MNRAHATLLEHYKFREEILLDKESHEAHEVDFV